MIRKMTKEDLEQVAVLEQELFSLPWKKEDFLRELEENDFAHYYVVEKQGNLIAYGGAWAMYDQAQITTIGTAKLFQGQGFGEKILRTLEKKMFEMGCEICTLEVRVSNVRAQRLYRKMGYEQVSIRKSYYSDNHEDAYLMMKAIGGQDGRDYISD